MAAMDGRAQPGRINRDAVRKVREHLTTLAESRNPNASVRPRVSRPQLIRALRREIAAAFRMEYDVQDIIDVLAQQGVDIDRRTFREYWRQAQKRKLTADKPGDGSGASIRA